jgi:GT2 family glycosyltransferase
MMEPPVSGETGPELSILLVNWNTREMTLACLRSIYNETRATSFEVIVVDNASHDGSVEAIAREFPQVVLMAEQENHGFGRATNLQAARARGRMILLLNTDTLVLDGAIDKLMAFARRQPQARIWGGRTLFADHNLNPTSCWGKPTPWSNICFASGLSAAFGNSSLFNPRAYPGWQRDSVREVGVVTGCLLLIEAGFWRELGGFDPAFFMYGEETDLCLRAAKLGARPKITPEATIIHYGGGSSHSRADKIVRLMACAITLSRKHDGAFGGLLARAALRAGVALRAGAYALAARIDRRRFADRAREWGLTWKRRTEWRSGWS